MLPELPEEILLHIIDILLNEATRSVIPLLLVNSRFRDLCLFILHTNLRFSSLKQMTSFVDNRIRLINRPKTLSILLAGGAVDPQYRLFCILYDIIARIRDSGLDTPKEIKFCLNSHTFDHNIIHLYYALSLVEYVDLPVVYPKTKLMIRVYCKSRGVYVDRP